MTDLLFTPTHKGTCVADFIDATGDCWEWTGSRDRNGYGNIRRQRLHAAHRYVYEALVGPIPAEMQLDHLCRNPACVNPDHLEPVTRAENLRRGIPGLLHAHCKQGHEMSGDNVYASPKTGKRMCRSCHKDRLRLNYLKRKGAKNG